MANLKITIELNCLYDKSAGKYYFNAVEFHNAQIKGIIYFPKRIEFNHIESKIKKAAIWDFNRKKYKGFKIELINTLLRRYGTPNYIRFNIDVTIFIDLIRQLSINEYKYFTQNGDLTPLDIDYYKATK